MSTSRVSKNGRSLAYHLTDSRLRILYFPDSWKRRLTRNRPQRNEATGIFQECLYLMSVKPTLTDKLLKKPLFSAIKDQCSGGQWSLKWGRQHVIFACAWPGDLSKSRSSLSVLLNFKNTSIWFYEYQWKNFRTDPYFIMDAFFIINLYGPLYFETMHIPKSTKYIHQ